MDLEQCSGKLTASYPLAIFNDEFSEFLDNNSQTICLHPEDELLDLSLIKLTPVDTPPVQESSKEIKAKVIATLNKPPVIPLLQLPIRKESNVDQA